MGSWHYVKNRECPVSRVMIIIFLFAAECFPKPIYSFSPAQRGTTTLKSVFFSLFFILSDFIEVKEEEEEVEVEVVLFNKQNVNIIQWTRSYKGSNGNVKSFSSIHFKIILLSHWPNTIFTKKAQTKFICIIQQCTFSFCHSFTTTEEREKEKKKKKNIWFFFGCFHRLACTVCLQFYILTITHTSKNYSLVWFAFHFSGQPFQLHFIYTCANVTIFIWAYLLCCCSTSVYFLFFRSLFALVRFLEYAL